MVPIVPMTPMLILKEKIVNFDNFIGLVILLTVPMVPISHCIMIHTVPMAPMENMTLK